MKKHFTLFSLLISVCVQQINAANDFVNEWTKKPNLPAEARHRAAGAMVGDKCYIGTGHYNANAVSEFKDWWEFDPSTNSWTQKADVPGIGRYGAYYFADAKKVFVGMGKSSWNFFNDFYSFDPITNTWTTLAPFPGGGRATGVSVYCKNKGYVGLGYGNGQPNDWWEYDIATNVWTPKAPFPGGGRLSPFWFTLNDKCYVGTGSHTQDMFEYDPATNLWTPKANFPGGPRHEVGGFAFMGKGYAGTGLDWNGNDYKDFWVYDALTNVWDSARKFEGTARRYLVTMNNISQTKAYAGLGTNGINQSDFWEFGPFTVGVQNQQNLNVKINVYPNPIVDKGTFEIISESNTSLIIELYDNSGRKVQTLENVTSGKTVFNRVDLRDGIYFYSVKENNKSIYSGKIILQ
jgi:N-acetylneuraminic acid mutarotase